MNLNFFLLAIIRFQRGSRIIVIDEIFATSFSRFAGPKHSRAKTDMTHASLASDRECKQLYRERIDDRTLKDFRFVIDSL